MLIDPMGARRAAAQFVRVSAAGVVADGMFLPGTERRRTSAPGFELDAAVAALPDGYSVELRLPLMSLRLPLQGGGAPWRIMATRSIPREEGILLVSAPLDEGRAERPSTSCRRSASLADIAERVRSHALLSMRPELTLRSTRRDDGLRAAQRLRRAPRWARRSEWRPRADWVFDATSTPTSRRSELDVPQLAVNTRFAPGDSGEAAVLPREQGRDRAAEVASTRAPSPIPAGAAPPGAAPAPMPPRCRCATTAATCSPPGPRHHAAGAGAALAKPRCCAGAGTASSSASAR